MSDLFWIIFGAVFASGIGVNLGGEMMQESDNYVQGLSILKKECEEEIARNKVCELDIQFKVVDKNEKRN